MYDTITRKQLSQLMGISYNACVQIMRNKCNGTLEALGKEGNMLFYNKSDALKWVQEWAEERDRKQRKVEPQKLMILNVNPQKPKKVVQIMDNVKNQFYSQHISEQRR
jgi:hypothetical protein